MKSKPQNGSRDGFTFIELVLVIGAITALSSAVMATTSVGRPISEARNSQRLLNVTSIVNAIGQNMADHKGNFTCAAGAIPTSTARISVGGYNLAPCLVSEYLSSMPFDPTAMGAHWGSGMDYDSGYAVARDPATGRITVSAPFAELEEEVSASR